MPPFVNIKRFLISAEKNQNFEHFNALLKEEKNIYSITIGKVSHAYAYDASLISTFLYESSQLVITVGLQFISRLYFFSCFYHIKKMKDTFIYINYV